MDDDLPLLDLFLTMLWFFLFIAWIWLLIAIITDVFRSQDLSGWGKALWTIFIVLLPLLGVLAYLIARGDEMHSRAAADAARREAATRAYIRETVQAESGGAGVSSGASTADELVKLAQLRDSGVITPEEFEVQKARALG